MICKHCGNEVLPGAMICVKCGAPVPDSSWPEGYTPVSAEQLRKERPAAKPEDETPYGEEAVGAGNTAAPSDAGIAYTGETVIGGKEAENADAEAPWTEPMPSFEEPPGAAAFMEAPEPLHAFDLQGSEEERQADRAITWGVIALVFGASMFLSPIGIIAGILARRIANSLLGRDGSLPGRARTGRTLGNVGLVIGVILTLFLALYAVSLIYVLREGDGTILSYTFGRGF